MGSWPRPVGVECISRSISMATPTARGRKKSQLKGLCCDLFLRNSLFSTVTFSLPEFSLVFYPPDGSGAVVSGLSYSEGPLRLAPRESLQVRVK